MKKALLLTSLLFTFLKSIQAQTADEYVTQGRSFLAATNIIAANNCFASALALSPAHQTANVLRALTRILVLPNEPAGKMFLDRINVSSSGRNVYNWTATLETDTQGYPLIPADVNANEAPAQLRTTLLPELIAAEANLATVTDTNFTLALTASETRTTGVILDYGDIQMLRAILEAGKYVCYTTHSWNWNAQLATIISLSKNDQLSVESLFKDYPSLLTFETTNELALAQAAFESGVHRYLEASQFIRSRSGTTTFLFNSDTSQTESEEKFRLTLVDLKNSLTSAVMLTVNSNYNVFASPLFNGTKSVRSLLPKFSRNGFVLGTPADLTLGGVILGLSREEVEKTLATVMEPVPTLSNPSSITGQQIRFPMRVMKGQGYTVQVSTNLTDWNDFYAFVAFDETNTLVDLEAGTTAHRFYRIQDTSDKMPVPSNDNFENRIPLTGMGATGVSYFSNVSLEPDESEYDLWWSWMAPVSGLVTIQPEPFAPIQVYLGSSLSDLTLVSNPEAPFLVTFEAEAGVTYQIQAKNYYQSLRGIRFLIGQAPIVTITSPEQGCIFSGPTNILISASASDPDGIITKLECYANGKFLASSTNNTLTIPWQIIQLGSHFVVITATDNHGLSGSAYTTVAIRPPNDDFVNATPISGSSITTTGTTVGAGMEADEPDIGIYRGEASVWWTWTAPSNGIYLITMEFKKQWMEPLLAVYTGTSFFDLNEMGVGVGVYPSTTAQVGFSASAGELYHICVNSGVDSGDFTLTVLPLQQVVTVVNDDFSDRIILGGSTVTETGSNVGATWELEEPSHFDGGDGGTSVWWSWTAPSSGTVTISTAGSTFDTILGVYTGDSLSTLTGVANDDDGGSDSTSLVLFQTEAGTTYQIAVDGFGAQSGNIALQISLRP